MKSRLLVTAAPALFGALLLAGLSASADAETVTSASPPAASGPFAQESTLPFHAPDFSKITDADYQPAIEQGIAIKLAEIKAIADNPAKPTFENTLVAMQRSGQMLGRAGAAFNQMVSANTNDTLDATDTALSPKLAAMEDEIYLNDKLFQRVKTLYDSRAKLGLKGEDAMLLETTYADFVHAGALLTPAQKDQLKAMNTRIAGLLTEFSQKLTDGTAAKAPIFDTAAELDGLSPDEISAAAALATKLGQPGKYALALINTTQQPQLTSLTNRESRKKLLEASLNRSNGGDQYDTTGIIIEIAKLRAEQAALLGQPNYAAWTMYDRMVKDPAKAIKFMDDFAPAVAATQTREGKMLQDMAASEGQTITLEPWDWGYYAEKVRKAKYDIDDATVKPYFNVWKTLEDGVFYAANTFYGLTFKRRTDIPTYHPDMRVYTVYDKDGSELGLFEFDPFARSNKQGGAWMGNFVEQSYLLGDKPVIYNSINITPPAEGAEPLATADDVTTMFHEFGHALHGFFASQKYPALSGTNTARDFVEFPSQFNENFAFLPQILNHYAQNAKGETIPAELIAKIEAAKKFNQSLEFGETLEAAMLDMKWHDITPDKAPTDAQAFEKQALGEIALDTHLIPPRYRSPYFRHIWSNGYSAGYYSYIWTEMLAHDGWDWVVKNGGPTRANGDHIRASFLGQGHTKDYAVMYRDFTGHDPSVQPMIEARGLDQK